MTEPTQRVPEDGVYVTYYLDMGTHLCGVHRSLTNAVAAADGYSREIGFARWDSEEIEPVHPSDVGESWKRLVTVRRDCPLGDEPGWGVQPNSIRTGKPSSARCSGYRDHAG